VSRRGLTSWPSACSWNMRRIHSSHSWLTPAARTAVKGALLCASREAGPTLDGHRSGGYARKRAESLAPASLICFQCVYAAMVQRIRTVARHDQFSSLPTRFQYVTECYHVNTLFFAAAERTLFIPFMFTLGSKWYLYSYPAGDDVSTFIRCARSVARLAGLSSFAI